MTRSRRDILRTLSGLGALAVGASGIAAAADCSGVAEWDASETYTGGDQVVYDDTLWEAKWWTSGDEPGASQWGPWEEVGPCGDDDDDDDNGDDGDNGDGVDCSGVPEWDSSETYQSADQAVFEGSLWEASWWTQGDEPGASAWGPWEEVGPCGDGGNESPTASFTVSPSDPEPDQEVTFDAGDSSDPDGSIASYEWDLGDGSSATGQTVTNRYESGEYTVTLTVTDGEGATASRTRSITVSKDDGSDGETPVEKHGQLQVIDTQLCDEAGDPVQLKGMSTHGIQWYGWEDCLTEAGLDALADDWEADILRISLYVQEGGYETDPEGFTQEVNRLIEEATERGLYALVDWHQLDPGDPNENLDLATQFFNDVVPEHAEKDNVLYDIANEPNNVSWSAVREYAEEMVPVIREHDSDAVVLCGTHGWASLGLSDGGSAQEIVDDPVDAENFMYTFHFYAASHGQDYRDELRWAADRLPIFVTEWGAQTYTGDGANDFDSARQYLDLMADKDISWTNWNYSDDKRSGAAWTEGTCPDGPWTENNLKESGRWVRDRIRGE